MCEKLSLEKQCDEWSASLAPASSMDSISNLMLDLISNIQLDFHIFKFDNNIFYFDSRNYTILSIDAGLALLLSVFKSKSLNKILETLHHFSDMESIKVRLAKIIDFVREGIFSSEQLQAFKKPSLSRLVLMLSSNCNMACSYCFERNIPMVKQENMLSKDKAKLILDWFLGNVKGTKAHIQLYGGEPLLNWSILQYVVDYADIAAKKRNLQLTKYLITNGVLLDYTKVDWLVKHDVSVQVSVDGDPHTHDRYRKMKDGSPTSHLIKSGIANLIEHKADFNLRAVLTKSNLNPEDILSGLRTWKTEHISFEPVATDETDIMLLESDWAEFNQLYQNYMRKPFHRWSDLPHEMKRTIINICENRHLIYGCGAGISEVTVSPDGNVYECQRLFRPPIEHIQNESQSFIPSEDFQIPVDDRDVCQDCWARYLCGGGCLHQSEVYKYGKSPFPSYCTMIKGIIESSIAMIYEMKRGNEMDDEI